MEEIKRHSKFNSEEERMLSYVNAQRKASREWQRRNKDKRKVLTARFTPEEANDILATLQDNGFQDVKNFLRIATVLLKITKADRDLIKQAGITVLDFWQTCTNTLLPKAPTSPLNNKE